jgi:hypothetical protein
VRQVGPGVPGPSPGLVGPPAAGGHAGHRGRYAARGPSRRRVWFVRRTAAGHFDWSSNGRSFVPALTVAVSVDWALYVAGTRSFICSTAPPGRST